MTDVAKERDEEADGETRRRPPRRPARRPRSRVGGVVARVVGLVATLALLGVGVAVLLTVTRDNGGKAKQETFAPTPKAAKTHAGRKASRPRPPRLTAAQRASRDAAVAQMRTQGFEPVAISTYKPRQSLRVLIGRPKASNGVRGRRAFFFVREQYIGTDSSSPSARLKVASQDNSKITLAYTRFAAGDKPCCPSDGTVNVRFSMGNGRLQPLDPIPPPAARLPPS
ncbi:MAG: hypothetical protein QOC68_2764 [Solirubrobacteraceae bacterium]|jgi:hypothetical protein|nr:hypothetical protein [Solirubrobacteraceae bacterium]